MARRIVRKKKRRPPPTSRAAEGARAALSKGARAALALAARDWESSYEQLGERLGCHHHSFPRWKSDYPDTPKPRQNGDHSVSQWREFFSRHAEIKLKTAGASKSDLEIERLRQLCRRLKFEQDAREGLYLNRAEVEAWLAGAAEAIKAILRDKLRNELPPKLEGLRAPEIAARMDDVIAVVLDRMRLLR